MSRRGLFVIRNNMAQDTADNMKEKIHAIIFDWGGVCCSEGEPFASAALQQKVRLGPDDIAKAVRPLYNDYYRGKYEGTEFWQRVMNHFGLSEDSDINPGALSAAYLSSYTLWPDMLTVAKQLQKTYRVGLLSDLTVEMRDHIRQEHDLNEIFESILFSCDAGVGRMKTDGPEIFEQMLEQMGATPEEALFIDNSKSKIAVAREVGLRTILFENKDQFFCDIQPYL